MTARDLFGRYLDLSPLGSRSRGLVRCCFHGDRTPSLSVDLDRGLFNCFSCHHQGGLRRFAELVGETLDAKPPSTLPRRPTSDRESARRAVLMDARRHAWAWRLNRLTSDEFRRRQRSIDHARRVATQMGADTESSWEWLAWAAAAERALQLVEPLLDETWRLVAAAPPDDRAELMDVLEEGLAMSGWLDQSQKRPLAEPRGPRRFTVEVL